MQQATAADVLFSQAIRGDGDASPVEYGGAYQVGVVGAEVTRDRHRHAPARPCEAPLGRQVRETRIGVGQAVVLREVGEFQGVPRLAR